MHLLLGIAAGAAIGYFLGMGVTDVILFSALSGASALLPDLDLRKSKASKAVYAISFALALCIAAFLARGGSGKLEEFALYAILISAALLAMDLLFRPRHRGVMHGVLFMCAASIACFTMFGWFSALAFAAGYSSHLIADSCIKL